MRENRQEGLLTAVWVGGVVLAAGVVVDLRWHATHGSAEGIGDLVSGHGVIWVGVLAVVLVAAVGVRRMPSVWYAGWGLLLVGAIIYAVSEGLHVWSHAAGHARVLTHVLLQVSKVAVVAGAISATVATRQRARDRPATSSANATPPRE